MMNVFTLHVEYIGVTGATMSLLGHLWEGHITESVPDLLSVLPGTTLAVGRSLS